MDVNIFPFTLGILMSLAASMDAGNKKNNLSLSLVIDCNKPDPIAKIDIDCCLDEL